MAVKSRNVIPAIKDKIVNFPLLLGTPPTGAGLILFQNIWYDYQIMSISATVITVTQAAACPFTIGYAAYTDLISGGIVAANATKYLPAASCLDVNGQSFSTAILPAGTFNLFTLQPDTTGAGTNILPQGAPLKLTVPGASNTGQIILNIVLRPKDWDRGDSSKRPWGASDESYASYLRT